MAFTAAEISQQMIAQLRVLDPSISAEPGTPERKIIDTVAAQVANSQLDLSILDSGLNIDGKLGANLDRFLALFNFGRQQPVAATGFVSLLRPNSPSTLDIRIPAGTQVVAPGSNGDTDGSMSDVFFRTTFDVTLPAGDTSVVAPIVAITPGVSGNVAAHRITEFVYAEGILAVDNDLATSGGLAVEDDDAFKARFKNTVFRNVSGTVDQFLALSIATPFTTKANVIGPISRYREYVQVPSTDDTTTSGTTGEYTATLSTLPYSKYTYRTVPYFVADGDTLAHFYRADYDFRLNSPPLQQGDTYRLAATSGNAADNPTRPNLTFLNVYTGTDDSVQGVRPGDVVLFEHSYTSTASRNDFGRGVTNAVDVFIDGGNDVVADAIIPAPNPLNVFVSGGLTIYRLDNYRRVGEPEHRPVFGNLFTPLFFEPVTELPTVITVGSVNYYLGWHYWLVEDITDLYGTVRARNGIEWSYSRPGQTSGDNADDPTTWTGPTIGWGDDTGETGVAAAVEITGYRYDKNIVDLQAALDSAKQTTTDVLAHKARTRYFKLDISVMYATGANPATANNDIRTVVANFFARQYFGAVIQLSDLMQAIHSLASVDNVRWSRDLPAAGSEIDTTKPRIVEANRDGSKVCGLVMDTIQPFVTGVQREQLQWYRVGDPTGGALTLTYNAPSPVTVTMTPTTTASTLQSALRTATGDSTLTVSGFGSADGPFAITYGTTFSPHSWALTANGFTGGPTVFNSDILLKDDELPALADTMVNGDTVPGLIIRPRAQGTWSKA